MSSRGRGIDPKGGQNYAATALSLVYHPAHPFVPTLRADVRLFAVRANGVLAGDCPPVSLLLAVVSVDAPTGVVCSLRDKQAGCWLEQPHSCCPAQRAVEYIPMQMHVSLTSTSG